MRALLLILCLQLTCSAATVTGTIVDATGTARSNLRIVFSPKSTPSSQPPNLISTKEITTTTDASGQFSTILQQGDYWVTIDRDRIGIAVTNSVATFDLLDITTQNLLYTYPVTTGAPTNANYLLYGRTNSALPNGLLLTNGLNVAFSTNGNSLVISASGGGGGSLGDGDYGDISVSGAGTAMAVDTNSVALGTDTTGDYVATLGGDTEIVVSGSGTESRAVTLSIGSAIARDSEVAAAYQPLDADLTRLSAISSASGDLIYRDAAGWTNLAKGVDGQVLKLASGLPAWGTDNTAGSGASISDDAFAASWDSDTTNGASRNALYDKLVLLQTGSANLTNWAALTPSAKQDALGYVPQLGSANLTNWGALAPSAKQDALGFVPQVGSANLTNWAALTPSAKQDALGYVPQLGSANLTNWGALAPSAKQDALGFVPQVGSANSTNWATLTTNASGTGNWVKAAGNTQSNVTVYGTLSVTNWEQSINAGVPNGSGTHVHWSQLVGVPAGFADNSDDGSGGGSGTVTNINTLTNSAPIVGGGGAGIYATNATGYLSLIGAQGVSATLVSELSIPAGAFSPGRTNAATYDTNSVTGSSPKTMERWLFLESYTNRVEIYFPMPSGWDAGAVKCKLTWSATNSAGTNVLQVRGVAMRDDDADTTAWGTAVKWTNVVTAAGDIQISAATPALTFGGTPAAGCLVGLEVFRDPSDAKDDQVGSVALLGLSMQYTRTNSPTAW